jgi:hypothetical protein
MSKILVDTIDTRNGTTTLTLGSSNAGTIALGSGDVQSNFLYPAFQATVSSNQSISDNASTKVTFDTEVYDTDSAYDHSSNYRFTPQVAGKYYVYVRIGLNANADSELNTLFGKIKKNGSIVEIAHFSFATNYARFGTSNVIAVVSLNGSSDYVEAFIQGSDQSGSASVESGTYSVFGAYRIGS